MRLLSRPKAIAILSGLLLFPLLQHFCNLSQSNVPSFSFPRTISSATSNFLDGCRYVYLDVGSNVGIQVRKLFEPNLYPEAKVHDIFDQAFGSPRDISLLCAVGFEPNPHHKQRLQDLERAYSACGWKTFFFKDTAVSNKNGLASFFTDDATTNNEWGASLVQEMGGGRRTLSNVTLIRLASFVNDVVGTRLIPNATSSHKAAPTVVMKMDIEGSEAETLPDLLLAGALNHVQYITIEWHGHQSEQKRKKQIEKASEILENLFSLTREMNSSKKFEVLDLDDETYHNSDFPLPICKKDRQMEMDKSSLHP